MRQSQQRLVAADELLATRPRRPSPTVSHADISWTEKLWGSLFARDGSIQVDVGIGKYHNRNVIDMFAGISRGKEQLTVRASRQLSLDPERVGVGPLDYEVVKPLKQVRFVLRENHMLPIRFDLTVTGVLPPFLEQKDAQREPHGCRIQSDLLRYHQASTVSGRIWVGRRDASRCAERSGSGSATTPGGSGWTSASPHRTSSSPSASTRTSSSRGARCGSGVRTAARTRCTTTCSGWTGR